MAIKNLAAFTEYDEYLNPIRGLTAAKYRAQLRMSLRLGQIPYYPRGLDDRWLFRLGKLPLAEVRKLLADIDPAVTLSNDQGRIVFSEAGFSLEATPASVQAMQTGVFT